MSDMVKRLRLQAEIGLIDAMNVPSHVVASYAEAADEIERLTAELASALAKVAQYEQAPVVGWKIEDWQQIYGIAGYRYLTSKQASVPREHWEGGEYDAFVSAMNAAIPLIARPEVTK